MSAGGANGHRRREVDPIPALTATGRAFELVEAVEDLLAAGGEFTHVEVRLDAALDPAEAAEALANAAAVARERGKKVVAAVAPPLLAALAERGALDGVDAVRVAADALATARATLARAGVEAELWIAEPARERGHALRAANGRPRPRVRERTAVVTGGAGFVGTNLASRLVEDGKRVVVVDSLARRGVEQNLRWLRETYGDRVTVEIADVRDRLALRRAVADADQVFHLAAQVAVTTSLDDPVDDFEVNVLGTVNLLEELRRLDDPPFVLFTSTNKVYGSLPDLELVRDGERWEPADAAIREHGLSEDRPLDFCTPYGCSKGAADQYVLDYAKSYGLPSVVFRMSCIYGPHQHGNEDQGWVAHFAIRALDGEPITVYGDGAQVRDVLFVEDLVEAMLLARDGAATRGRAYNVGGGAANSISLLELLELIGELHGRRPDVRFAEERAGDQRYYVADTRRFGAAAGWRPLVSAPEGVERLYRWLAERRAPVGTRLRAVAR